MTWRQQLQRWWLGANRAGLKGGSTAVVAFFSSAGASQVVAVPAMTLEQGGWIFAFAFGYEFFKYLSVTPIPEIPAEVKA